MCRSRPLTRTGRSARRRRASAALALLLALTACGDDVRPRDMNLLVISIDTLRADRLGCYGNDEWGESPSPTLDALAARGVLVERCYAPRGQTHPSLASLLTGLYPVTHGIRDNDHRRLDPAHTTLLEHFARHGFRTGAFLANFRADTSDPRNWAVRGAASAGSGFGDRLAQEGGDHEGEFQAVWDDRVEAGALDFLRGHDGARRFALWTHFYDVHAPYNPSPGFEKDYGFDASLDAPLRQPGRLAGSRLDGTLARMTLGSLEPSPAELRRIRGLYDNGVAATDARVARLLAELERSGELERTVIVITADHGEELFDHNRYFYHSGSIYDGVVRVPLLVVAPEIPAGSRARGVASLVDLAPTLLAMFDLPADADHEGRDLGAWLAGAAPDSPRTHAFVEWQDRMWAVADDTHKLILNPQHVRTRKVPWHDVQLPDRLGFEVDCVEGYAVADDPGERANLLEGLAPSGVRAAPAPFPALEDALREWLVDPRHQTPFGAGADARDDELEELRQLGYLGAGDDEHGARLDSRFGEPCED